MGSNTRTQGLDDLVVAAERGDQRTVKEILLQHRCDVNARDVAGYTALHYAASAGHDETVGLLLEYGADVNAQQVRKGQTPLHCACNGGHVEVVRRLLQRPEAINSINATTKHMLCTPLHCCAFAGAERTTEVALLLLEHGALVDQRDTAGQTPLVYTARKGMFPELARVLIAAGADVSTTDNKQIAVLHYAAATNNGDIVAQLIAAGASPNPKPGKGQPLPPLHIAARQGFFNAALALLRGGAAVNEVSTNGRTAMHLAVQSGEVKLVELFAKTGANLDAKDENGFTPLSYAAQSGHSDIVNVLLNMGADPNVATKRHRWTPLHLAAKYGHQLVMSLLVNCPRTEVNALDAEHRTAMHWTAFRGDTPGCIVLAENSVNLTIKDSCGYTAAGIAGARLHTMTERELVSRGGAVESQRKRQDDFSTYWVDDGDAVACFACRRRFTVTLRRHHCRECCGVFCNQCTSKRVAPPHRLAKLRLCDECFYTATSTPELSTRPLDAPAAGGSRAKGSRSQKQQQHMQQQAQQQQAQQQQQEALQQQQTQAPPRSPPKKPVNEKYIADQLAQLQAGREMRNESDGRGFTREYASFSSIGRKNEVRTSQLPENRSRNRYGDILPYDKTRVTLSALFHGGQTDYINANYVNGHKCPRHYIACQGPLPHTVGEFWQMVWEQETGVIVMLTGQVERGKVKCHQYWPAASLENTGREEIHGDFAVSLISTETHADYIVRRLQLRAEACVESTREIIQFAFTSWPDHGAPSQSKPLLQFHRVCKTAFRRSNLQGPPIVHCSAGVGRSGTFIVLDWIDDLINDEQPLDIPAILREIRQQRMNLVQTLVQYTFIWKAAIEMVKAAKTRAGQQQEHVRPPQDRSQGFSNENDDELVARAVEMSMETPNYIHDPAQEDEALQLALALSLSEQEAAQPQQRQPPQRKSSVKKAPSGQQELPSSNTASAAAKQWKLPQQFHIKYLGSQRVKQASKPVVQQAFQKVMARCKEERPLALTVATGGIELSEIDSDSGTLYPLQQVAFCQAIHNPPLFAFVTRHVEKSELVCHCFRCPNERLGQLISSAVTRAFQASAESKGLAVTPVADDDPELAAALIRSQKEVTHVDPELELALKLSRAESQAKQAPASSSAAAAVGDEDEDIQLAMALSRSLAETSQQQQQHTRQPAARASSLQSGSNSTAVGFDASNPFAFGEPTAAASSSTEATAFVPDEAAGGSVCETCSESLEADAQFCGNCGNRVQEVDESDETNLPEPDNETSASAASSTPPAATAAATASGAHNNPFFDDQPASSQPVQSQPTKDEQASRKTSDASVALNNPFFTEAKPAPAAETTSNAVADEQTEVGTNEEKVVSSDAVASEPASPAEPARAAAAAAATDKNPFAASNETDNGSAAANPFAAEEQAVPSQQAEDAGPSSSSSSSSATSATTSTSVSRAPTPSAQSQEDAPAAAGSAMPALVVDSSSPEQHNANADAASSRLAERSASVSAADRSRLLLNLGEFETRPRSCSQDIKSEADRLVLEAKERLRAARHGSDGAMDSAGSDSDAPPSSPVRAPPSNAPFSSPSLLLTVAGQKQKPT